MRKTLAVLLTMIASPALAASPQGWCVNATDQGACLEYAAQDDEECSGMRGVKYDNCRQQLMMMRQITGTPAGPIEIKDCSLPSGAVVSMNAKTCEQQGGTY